MYIHFCRCIYNIIHVCTWYVHGMYKQWFKRVRTSFRRVCTCLCIYVHVLNHANMYIQCTNLYIKGLCSWCWVYRRLHTFRKMYRHRWTVYVHWYILLAVAVWFTRLAGWLACRLELAAATWCHAYSNSSAYSSSSTRVYQPWALAAILLLTAPARPLLPPPRLLPPGLGTGGGSSPQDAAAAPASGGVAGVAAAASAVSASGARSESSWS